MTDASTLEDEFAIAVAQEGDAYRAARTAILQRGQPALPFLRMQQTSPDWLTVMTASILIGWLTEQPLFEQCTAAIVGDLAGPVPITGSFPARRRVAAVTRLGTAVTPRLLEMALKTKELGDAEQTAAIFGSLLALKDPRAVVPLIETMKTSADDIVGGWATSTLGPLQDRRAAGPLVAILRDPAAPETRRAAAAISLGTLGVRDALPALRAVVADRSANPGFRKAAIGAIGDLGDADSAEMLLATLPGTPELTYQLNVLTVVGDIGGANVLPALQEIERRHPEEPVRDYAKEARERIEERIGVRNE